MEMFRLVRIDTALVGLCLLTTVGCYDPNAHLSPIVRAVELRGSGDLSAMTMPEIGGWLADHVDAEFVTRLNEQCAAIRSQADAGWAYRTAEGRVCAAVQALHPPVPIEIDHTQFGSVR
jgi:hypothetical protein